MRTKYEQNDFAVYIAQGFRSEDCFHKAVVIDRIFGHTDIYGKLNDFCPIKTLDKVPKKHISI